MIQVRRGKYGQAVEQFELALKRDPDNLTVKCHLADAYFRLGRREAALDAYGEVLRVAPGNVGAHIGTGEVMIEQAQEASDDLLYEDAEVHFTKAIDLAASVRFGSPDRIGSSGLGVRQWSDLRYSRGYVRVKVYEAQMSNRVGRPARAARSRLEDALLDFEGAKKIKVSTRPRGRAVDRVRGRLKRFSSAALSDLYAPFVVVGVTSLLLLLVQAEFFRAGRFSGDQDSVAYTTLTLSLLILLVAGFYLPQVLKLKLAESNSRRLRLSRGLTELWTCTVSHSRRDSTPCSILRCLAASGSSAVKNVLETNEKAPRLPGRLRDPRRRPSHSCSSAQRAPTVQACTRFAMTIGCGPSALHGEQLRRLADRLDRSQDSPAKPLCRQRPGPRHAAHSSRARYRMARRRRDGRRRERTGDGLRRARAGPKA